MNFGNVCNAKRFAELSLRQQVACIRQTMSVVYEDGYKPLRTAEVNLSELETVFKLASPQYSGPWASSVYEYKDSWKRWAPERGDLFEPAVKGEFWRKYMGLPFWDYHGMGSTMHCIRFVLEQKWDDNFHTATPIVHFPAYQKAIAQRKFKSPLVLGAFSMMSVLGWCSIRDRLLAGSKMSLIDVEGKITEYVAEKCGMLFKHENALEIGISRTGAHDLILTNSLTRMLEPSPDLWSLGEKGLRAELFRQCYLALSEGGNLVMAEHFLEGDSIDTVKQQVELAGFSDFTIEPTLHIPTCKQAFGLMRTGKINKIETLDVDVMYTLIANKGGEE
jgi:hypothetical protein